MVEPIFKRSAGLDVHKKMVMATILLEEAEGNLREETREFNTFPQDLIALAKWLKCLCCIRRLLFKSVCGKCAACKASAWS